MSQFIRQWRKDIRDLGTPEFDAAAALRDMMARRADIQNLASNEQRMALDLQDESRKKESHPLELEGKRQANTSLGLANKRFPRDAQIRDADEGRRAEVERRNQTAEAAAAAKAQLQADVTTGKLDPAEAADMATRMAESQLSMERGVSVVNDPVEVNRRAGASLEGLEVPFDSKADRFRADREARAAKDMQDGQYKRVTLAERRVRDALKAAGGLNNVEVKKAEQGLESYKIGAQEHARNIENARAAIETGVNLNDAEMQAATDYLKSHGVSPSAIKKREGANGYVLDETAAGIAMRTYLGRFAPKLPGNAIISDQAKEYFNSKADLIRQQMIYDVILQRGREESGIQIPLEETVKQPEPTRQEAPPNRKPAPVKRAPVRVTVPEQDVSVDGSPGVVAREKRLREIGATQVSPSVWRHPNGKFFDINTGERVPDPRAAGK